MIITVFDFDDTLFPTTEYTSTKNIDYELLSHSINDLLQGALIRSDKVFIITNANIEWLQLCCENMKIVDFSGVIIKSTIQEGMNIGHAMNWKKNMFEKFLSEYFIHETPNLIQELVCFGDSLYDRYASDNMKKLFPYSIVKNFKFTERPTFFDLIGEQYLIKQFLNDIYDFNIDMDKTLIKNYHV